MGDRNNPIKFGPEWLRNLARERNASSQGSNSQNAPLASGNGASPGAVNFAGARATSPVPGNPLCAAVTTQKIHLAKLRYGREEMLALYDRTVEAPSELKSIDQLYQPRGKPPFALHNTFEEEMRDNLRSGPPIGAMTPDKFGRGLGRGLPITDNRGRPRMPFVRQPSLGRSNAFHQRIPGYPPGADEDAPSLPRSWSNSNGGTPANRTVNEQPEWTPNKTFRSKRQSNNTNWRSPQTREEGEEWRLSDPGRPRTGQQDKWERDWGDRPNQEKPPLWNHNRRTWGGDAQNEEILPEWAMDNAEACAGTFDSSGAFHGYSNDDTNLPRNQEASYSLTRSHTHGSFARLKSVEDGSEEWWASAKAKKLSPKKFDASEIKFKKQVSITAAEDSGNTSSSSKQSSTSKEESNIAQDTQENQVTSPDSSDSGQAESTYPKNNAFRPKFSENKTFDALMRSDINMDEASDERGNFQSVTIKPNNSLRQKHQNIVASGTDNQQVRTAGMPGAQDVLQTGQMTDKEHSKLDGKSLEDAFVDNIFEMTLDDKDLLSKLPSVISGLPLNTSMSSGKVSIGNSVAQASNTGMQNRGVSPNHQNQGNVLHKPNLSMAGMPGMHSSAMHTLGLQTSGTKAPGLQSPGLHPHGLLASSVHPGMPAHGLSSPGAQPSGIPSPAVQNSGLQNLGLQAPGQKNPGMPSPAMQNTALQALGMQNSGKSAGLPSPGMQTQGIQTAGMQSHAMQMSGMQAPGMQGISLQALGMQSAGMQPGLQNTGNQTSSMHNIGISNTALNSAMRLQGPRLLDQGSVSNSTGHPHQRMSPPPLLLNPAMTNTAMSASGMQPSSTGMTGFQNSAGIQGMPNTSSSLFGLGQNPSNTQISMGFQMPPSNDIPMPNHAQNNMFPMHGLPHSGSQAPFNSLYGNMNMMRQSPPQNTPNSQSLADHWYYEDPKQTVQGPFSSKDMYNWYRAGFFTPSLMVRRACDAHMRPLGSYGSVVPFAQVDMASFSMSSGFGMRNQGPHDSMINSQPGLGLDVDSLWGQTSTSPDLMWMQQTMNARNDMRVNLPMFFWDQSSAVTSNSMLPDEIVKEMKTEDQILAQLRASQGVGTVPNIPFMNEQSNAPVPPSVKPEEDLSTISATPNLEELHKLMQKDTLIAKTEMAESKPETKEEVQTKPDKTNKLETSLESVKSIDIMQIKQQDTRQVKQNKAEIEKSTKTKENKSKIKKVKEDKKDEGTENIKEEDSNKLEKKSADSSPSKSKKEDKVNKKELEKEKKEWIKEGFTIVKGPEKTTKDKKKAEEVKLAEEAERKRKEEEKVAAEEEKKKKHAEAVRKQQQEQKAQQREASEAVVKKAPWSAAASLAQQATSRDGLSLAEIQRLEREKKLEQMKEQQQMMQAIAQQQAAALARDQEMQASLGWAKKKPNPAGTGLSLAEIQAEARKQSAAAAAAAEAAAQAAAQVLEDAPAGPAPANHLPWGNNTHNGGGFWDSPATAQPSKPAEKSQETQRVAEQNVKNKKKNTLNVTVKKEASPGAEFDTWCNTVLASWSAKIDVPTFVGFLKDIESPYEVKDYVKCYLSETKESSDFARQFLEKRSKLLRVGMVTPSDDLCSPAVAVNPRTTSGSDYQEGKGKKTKKNKMLKVDARILGFSVTASEDRINVGDIDTV